MRQYGLNDAKPEPDQTSQTSFPECKNQNTDSHINL